MGRGGALPGRNKAPDNMGIPKQHVCFQKQCLELLLWTKPAIISGAQQRKCALGEARDSCTRTKHAHTHLSKLTRSLTMRLWMEPSVRQQQAFQGDMSASTCARYALDDLICTPPGGNMQKHVPRDRRTTAAPSRATFEPLSLPARGE